MLRQTCYSISCTSRVGGGRGQGADSPRRAGGGSNLSALLETMDTCVIMVAGMQCQVPYATCPCHCGVICCGANSLCACQSASVLRNQVSAELQGAVSNGVATVRICDYWARELTIVISSSLLIVVRSTICHTWNLSSQTDGSSLQVELEPKWLRKVTFRLQSFLIGYLTKQMSQKLKMIVKTSRFQHVIL